MNERKKSPHDHQETIPELDLDSNNCITERSIDMNNRKSSQRSDLDIKSCLSQETIRGNEVLIKSIERSNWIAALLIEGFVDQNPSFRLLSSGKGSADTERKQPRISSTLNGSLSRLVMLTRCLGLVYFLSGCQTTTARFVDSRNGEIALVSTEQSESLHAAGLKGSVPAKAASNVKKSTDGAAGPDKVRKYLQLSKLELLRGDLDSSESSVKKCLEVDLKNNDAKLVLAQIYFRKGLFDLAEIILNSSEFTGTAASEMQNIKALIAYQNKNYAAAWAILEDSVRLDPSNIAARLNFGMLLLEHQLTQKSAIQFERILQLVPKQPDALLMMAMIEARRGNHAIALKTLDELSGEFKENPTLVFNYGSVLFHNGNYEEASNNLHSYLKTTTSRNSPSNRSHKGTNHSQDAIAMIEDIKERLDKQDEMQPGENQNLLATATNATALNITSAQSEMNETQTNEKVVTKNSHSSKKQSSSNRDLGPQKSKQSNDKNTKKARGATAHQSSAPTQEEASNPSNSAQQFSENQNPNQETDDLDQLLKN